MSRVFLGLFTRDTFMSGFVHFVHHEVKTQKAAQPRVGPATCQEREARSKISPELTEAKMKVDLRAGTLLGSLVLVLVTTGISQNVDDRIQQLYTEAQSEDRQGRGDAAIQKYQAILRLNPKLPAAYNNLGQLYFQQGRFEEAIKSLKKACELDSKLAAPRALLGLSLYQVGDIEDAHRELQTALQLNPSDRNVKLFLARSLFELDDLKGALKLLDQLQQEDPKNTEVLYSIGIVYMMLAQSALGEIQTVDPNSHLIEILLGQYAEIKQNYLEAIEHYKKAIANSPKIPALYYYLAHALWASGRFQEALPEYQRALELNPYDYNAAWEAARLVLPEDPEAAFRLTTRAIELKSDIPGAYSIRGRALLALKRPQEAVEDLKKAISLDPEDAALHYQLAMAYRQLGMSREANSEIAIHERMARQSHSPKEDKGLNPP
jgi:tetratricopeptide (TPR) repeat protein